MTDHTLGAHTHSDHPEIDARTVARVVRHATVGLAVALAVLSLVSLGLGLSHDTQEAFMIGCTVLVCSVFAGAVALGVYMVELVIQGQSEIREEQSEMREEMREVAEDHREFRQRFASLEAGERAIADAVCSISDPPDELHVRRRGGSA